MIFGSRKQLAKISVGIVTVGDAMMKPITSLQNFGVWFDHDIQHMTLSDNIKKMFSKAFYSL